MSVDRKHSDRVREYYVATDRVYLDGWASGQSRAYHFGLADEDTRSNEESLINTNRFLAARAGVTKGSRVLDAGCGVGGSALWLAETYGAQVVGITLVQQQVELARAFVRERKLESLLTFECMDMTATSFPEASFDVVWSLESMPHLLDVNPFLRHAANLLRDMGRFVCIHYCRTDRADERLLKVAEDGWAMPPLAPKEVVLAGMERAGFEQIEHEDLTPRAIASAQALRAMASKTLLTLRADQAFLGKEQPAYEGHVRAALAMVDAFESGQLTLSFFGGVRPARR